MKTKLRFRLGISAALGIIAIGFAASAYASSVNIGAGYQQESLPEATVPAQVSGTTGEIFILREYEGYVAVFTSDFENTPATVTNIEVDSLRGVDRDLLDQGITAKSYSELMLLLEDFGS